MAKVRAGSKLDILSKAPDVLWCRLETSAFQGRFPGVLLKQDI